MTLPPRLSFVTLGVADLDRSMRFDNDALGRRNVLSTGSSGAFEAHD